MRQKSSPTAGGTMPGMDSVLSPGRGWRELPRLLWRVGTAGGAILLTMGAALLFNRPPEVVRFTPPKDCRLELAACRVEFAPGAALTLDVAPRPISPNAPLTIAVQLAGIDARHIEASFRGVDMNMGVHELELQPAGEGEFRGSTTLPVCVSGRMSWEITLRLTSGRQIYLLPVRFDSGA